MFSLARLLATLHSMTIMPLGDARDHLSRLADEVERTHDRVTITRHGHPSVTLVATEDLEALEETLDVFATPGALEEIRRSEDDIAQGDTLDEAGLRELIARRKGEEPPAN